MALFKKKPELTEEEKRAEKEREDALWQRYILRKNEPELAAIMELPIMEERRSIFTPSQDFEAVATDETHRLVRLMPCRYADLYYKYEDIRDCELMEINTDSPEHAITGMLVGGALLGGAGAVAGTMINNREVVRNMFLRVDINDPDHPCVYVNFVQNPVDVGSIAYRDLITKAHKAVSCLNLIMGKDETGSGQPAMNPYEEIKQLKELLDLGAVTEEEFTQKKRMLLGL